MHLYLYIQQVRNSPDSLLADDLIFDIRDFFFRMQFDKIYFLFKSTEDGRKVGNVKSPHIKSGLSM